MQPTDQWLDVLYVGIVLTANRFVLTP